MSIEILEAAVSGVLSKLPSVTREVIRVTIENMSRVPDCEATDEEKERLARELESRLDVTMANGTVVQEDIKPWLGEARRSIDPYYWDRYHRLLGDEEFPPRVITTIDKDTDRILDLLQNPKMGGAWDRRGMVVGHVQSGKTANYTGLICKAADAGYRLIIVIAGIHNNLRNQTQERIDSGFVGRDSSRLDARQEKRYIGVGRLNRKEIPVTVTSSARDFNRQTAESVGVQLKALKVPAILVIKKNSRTLDNVINWLRAHNASGSRIMDAPMLLIDDEADNASIDISNSPDQASRINSQIRQLLNLFDKKCYVGYTATPFANIFIDPDTDHAMFNADLFPRDFIVTIEPPSNYFGSTRIFTDDADCDVVRDILDNEDLLPIRHPKEHEIVALPESLKDAIRTFILARAIRLLRVQVNKHNSMLVNTSRFTGVQHQLRDVIHEFVKKLENRIRYEAGKPSSEALKDGMIRATHAVWQREYGHLEFTWDQIQSTLRDSISPIMVIEVNSSRTATGLNYREYRDTGLNVIAVGGFSLSRGLTLEGLLVSYFLRNSMMYDTLMQMGRWFGYRPGHEDVCRIWMTREASGWYAHITESMEELRDEMRQMERAKLTPKDFGLKVRNHPDTLIVTARNKMRTAECIRVRVGLANEFIETTTIWHDAMRMKNNRKSMAHLVGAMGGRETSDPNLETHRNNWFWTGVSVGDVLEFLNAFKNHPFSPLSNPGPVSTYIRNREADELPSWDVVLINKGDPLNPKEGDHVDRDLFGFPVVCQQRTAGKRSNDEMVQVGSKQRVASRPIEDLGLDNATRQEAEKEFFGDPKNRKRNPPDRIYRRQRSRPLLILHLLSLFEDAKDRKDRYKKSIVHGAPAWGISFPPSGRKDPTVEYMVNTTWWREQFGVEQDDDMEGDDDR